eukprot:6192631-Pleurochrysis_carterae.AAC.1
MVAIMQTSPKLLKQHCDSENVTLLAGYMLMPTQLGTVSTKEKKTAQAAYSNAKLTNCTKVPPEASLELQSALADLNPSETGCRRLLPVREFAKRCCTCAAECSYL